MAFGMSPFPLQFGRRGGGLPRRPWLPTDIAGNCMWHRHDLPELLTLRAVEATNYIAARSDAGTAGKGAAQSTEDYQPLLIADAYNGLPVARYDGSNDYLVSPAGNIGDAKLTTEVDQTWTYMALVAIAGTEEDKCDFASNPNISYGSQGLSFNWNVPTAASRSPRLFFGGTLTNTSGGAQNGELNCIIITWTGTVGTLYVNGGTGIALTPGAVTTGPTLHFGCQNPGLRHCAFDEAERYIIDEALGTADRQRLEGYALHKYGRQAALPGGHPYKSSPPTIVDSNAEALSDNTGTLLIDNDGEFLRAA